jgi:hypothetical protein
LHPYLFLSAIFTTVAPFFILTSVFCVTVRCANDLCKIGVLNMMATMAASDSVQVQQMTAVVVANCVRTGTVSPRKYANTGLTACLG